MSAPRQQMIMQQASAVSLLSPFHTVRDQDMYEGGRPPENTMCMVAAQSLALNNSFSDREFDQFATRMLFSSTNPEKPQQPTAASRSSSLFISAEEMRQHASPTTSARAQELADYFADTPVSSLNSAKNLTDQGHSYSLTDDADDFSPVMPPNNFMNEQPADPFVDGFDVFSFAVAASNSMEQGLANTVASSNEWKGGSQAIQHQSQGVKRKRETFISRLDDGCHADEAYADVCSLVHFLDDVDLSSDNESELAPLERHSRWHNS